MNTTATKNHDNLNNAVNFVFHPRNNLTDLFGENIKEIYEIHKVNQTDHTEYECRGLETKFTSPGCPACILNAVMVMEAEKLDFFFEVGEVPFAYGEPTGDPALIDICVFDDERLYHPLDR